MASSMLPLLVGGPDLPQERCIATGTLPGPASRAILARRERAVSSALATAMPFAAVAAGGGVVIDADGNSLIDLGSGIAVTSVGNADPAVARAVAEQAARLTHACAMLSPYESYVAVAEALNRLTPGEHDKRTVLFSTGAEAVENAVKVARAYTGRSAVVAFENAYHGRTNLTMALTAKARPYKAGFGPFTPDVYRAPASDPFRDGLTGADAAARAIDHIERHVGVEDLAAVVIEPIQGEGGFIVPAPGFLEALAAWSRAQGVVFIADEVQTGFARTGTMFASEQFGIVPDVIATAKGIAGGLPLAAVTGRAEIMNAPAAGGLGGTFGGNPVACAAALATIDAYETGGLADRAREIGALLEERLAAISSRDPRIGDIRGRGAMIAAELVDPATGAPDAALAKRLAAACVQRGVILLTCGTYGNVIRFLPPLTIGDELLDDALDVIARELTSL
ncbi:4-aminobutyrate--2-oxoglutarate transaminase [Microbacterium sp. ZXX196]|uniref:4-aminobutyrate--2-oxoglutarate transaminase n=1 Tax=Microbacterium sp. ZXX196 TaxID=2609291 RepID=UPI0012B9DEFF|nr:4-aminobutyrate--2-oxoglutarate transaminase [Microbacterium sp. ZXX196]MTE23484.1 4-aminobutyrate--2-oxoglutarate transaminase [Microbacterium sp. ZXX196]